MIYTVTFNPALDYVVRVFEFHSGRLNKTEEELLLPGGKGLNVSEVLTNLGEKTTALGFIGGFTGDEIARLESERGVICDFVKVEGNSRINVKLKSAQETEINANGPEITTENLLELYRKLQKLQSGDILVLAGSIPRSIPDTAYSDIMTRLENKGIRIIVDAASSLLVNVLDNKPFLIKPNHIELADLFKAQIGTDKELIVKYARKLLEKGAQNVLVSMGGDGAILVCSDNRVFYAAAPKGEVVNSVGAGDSMVAGFIYGLNKSGDFSDALRWGIACGSASTFSEYLAIKEDVLVLYDNIGVEMLNI